MTLLASCGLASKFRALVTDVSNVRAGGVAIYQNIGGNTSFITSFIDMTVRQAELANSIIHQSVTIDFINDSAEKRIWACGDSASKRILAADSLRQPQRIFARDQNNPFTGIKTVGSLNCNTVLCESACANAFALSKFKKKSE
ncbi:hypothetical protein EVAR_38393_1 [Eumeta japonica]|uniref:Uncharacterized protein n=1 Tax=Eumeta variegata TaxID=151549 RepID=A0A4C1YL17_EUMVA|nr:hypothetical protein EVAR_38393_1 [Eumeta japonica]